MKAWAKRMIWFSIMHIAILFNDIGNFLLEFKAPEGSEGFIAIVWLSMLIIPLIFMKDDKCKNTGKGVK